MGYPHAPHHHVQSPMGMGSGLDPKFPPVADDYHHYNHYSMTASTGQLNGGDNSMPSHPHATHPADMVDYMAHHHHHTNSALSGHHSHHQNSGYSNYGHHHPHTHHQGLGYYGHHAAAAAAAHHAPEYISAGVVHSDTLPTSLGGGYSSSVNGPNDATNSSELSAIPSNGGYYSGYYGTNGSAGSTHSHGHSPHSQMMDLPLQCSSTEPPSNTALGLQELGEYKYISNQHI